MYCSDSDNESFIYDFHIFYIDCLLRIRNVIEIKTFKNSTFCLPNRKVGFNFL